MSVQEIGSNLKKLAASGGECPCCGKKDCDCPASRCDECGKCDKHCKCDEQDKEEVIENGEEKDKQANLVSGYQDQNNVSQRGDKMSLEKIGQNLKKLAGKGERLVGAIGGGIVGGNAAEHIDHAITGKIPPSQASSLAGTTLGALGGYHMMKKKDEERDKMKDVEDEEKEKGKIRENFKNAALSINKKADSYDDTSSKRVGGAALGGVGGAIGGSLVGGLAGHLAGGALNDGSELSKARGSLIGTSLGAYGGGAYGAKKGYEEGERQRRKGKRDRLEATRKHLKYKNERREEDE